MSWRATLLQIVLPLSLLVWPWSGLLYGRWELAGSAAQVLGTKLMLLALSRITLCGVQPR